jgi:hypothetical protein
MLPKTMRPHRFWSKREEPIRSAFVRAAGGRFRRAMPTLTGASLRG